MLDLGNPEAPGGDACLQGAHEMILEMVGHRDPNLVPVAAFYGDPDLKVNFCGKLATDPHPQVRCRVRAGLSDQRHRPQPLRHAWWCGGAPLVVDDSLCTSCVLPGQNLLLDSGGTHAHRSGSSFCA